MEIDFALASDAHLLTMLCLRRNGICTRKTWVSHWIQVICRLLVLMVDKWRTCFLCLEITKLYVLFYHLRKFKITLVHILYVGLEQRPASFKTFQA